MRCERVRFTRIINGLSLTQCSLNDWRGPAAKVPSHCETLDAPAEQLSVPEQHQRAHTCTDPHLYRPASYSICKSAASETHHVDHGSGLFFLMLPFFFFIFKIWIIIIVLCSFRLHETEKQTGQGVLLTAGVRGRGGVSLLLPPSASNKAFI